MLIYDNNILENESKNNYIALGSFDGLAFRTFIISRKS